MIAEETTTTAASTLLALWPIITCAPLAQALGVGALGGVGALHLIAEIEQHFGDAGHADAADADEMYGAKLARQFHAMSASLFPIRLNPPHQGYRQPLFIDTARTSSPATAMVASRIGAAASAVILGVVYRA